MLLDNNLRITDNNKINGISICLSLNVWNSIKENSPHFDESFKLPSIFRFNVCEIDNLSIHYIYICTRVGD